MLSQRFANERNVRADSKLVLEALPEEVEEVETSHSVQELDSLSTVELFALIEAIGSVYVLLPGEEALAELLVILKRS